jgi:hypothetical protein
VENLTTYQQYFSFMSEYAGFLEAMVDTEKEKLDALLSNQLKRIEHSVSCQQAVSMQIENYEKRRLQLQKQAGFGDITFHEMIERVDPEEQEKLKEIFGRMRKAAEEVKFLNEKSMKLVKANMQVLNSSVPSDLQANGPGYTQDGMQPEWNQNSKTLFETKI